MASRPPLSPTTMPTGNPTSASQPQPNVVTTADGIRYIDIQGWRIASRKQPISASDTIEHYEQQLGFPIPEMIFGSNYLRITHQASGLALEWNAWDALGQVDKDLRNSAWLQVAHAKEWSNYRLETSSNSSSGVDLTTKAKSPALAGTATTTATKGGMGTTALDTAGPFTSATEMEQVTKKYDWTYSTTYPGTLIRPPGNPTLEFQPTETLGINYDRLKLQEPILFFDDFILYEDELADNGISLVNVKVRVMSFGFFILQRFYLRVDGVAFRLFDTRVYHEFGQPFLVRECLANESGFEGMVQRLPRTNDRHRQPQISLLADSAWVAHILANSPGTPIQDYVQGGTNTSASSFAYRRTVEKLDLP
ncbi:Tap42 interacting protein [Dispira parvispora]|uniref:Tap42 interacting protein n=1 Tax=Dispira parvispora TaxID=1520584 RepID=A0A9W8ALV4_9FUNG|nr:Tap42 interacting protein [Dispira parvispora]